MYDLVAGRRLVKSSYYVNKEKTLELFPMLKRENLCGAVIYYDGMIFNYALSNKTVTSVLIQPYDLQ